MPRKSDGPADKKTWELESLSRPRGHAAALSGSLHTCGPHRSGSRRHDKKKNRSCFPLPFPFSEDEGATARGENDAAASPKPSPRFLPPMTGSKPAPAASQNPSSVLHRRPPPPPPPPPVTAVARVREEGELSSGADDDEVSSRAFSTRARSLVPGSSCFSSIASALQLLAVDAFDSSRG